MAPPVVYVLTAPVQSGTETITELHIRRPKAKDVRAVRTGPQAQPFSETLDLIGRLACQPKHVVDDLDMEDVNAITEIIEGFSKSGPKTGDTASQ